jgi:Skp family chaperone for outer membrane proteins
MKRNFVFIILVTLAAAAAYAIKITAFVSTDVFAERAQDIIVAECLSFPKLPENVSYGDGLYPVEVHILMTLKGSKKPGKEKIATIYPMELGRKYLLTSLGGSIANEIDLLAIPELSVVELPQRFDLELLKNKTLTEQLMEIFKRRYVQVGRDIKRLENERALLQKALKEKNGMG